MSDIQVVRRQAVSYTAQGESATSEESYIKILTSFRNGTLRKLQGAPLSAFLSVALHEADDPAGVTMEVIADETGVSYRHLLRVMPKLCKDRYCVIAEIDPEGNQIYRVAAYAWFGSNNQRSNRRPLPPARGSNTPPAPLPNTRSHDILSHAIGVPIITVIDSSKPIKVEEKTKTTKPNKVACAILRSAGVYGKVLLERWASEVSEETARAWADWISGYRGKSNPQGIAVNALREDSGAMPYMPEEQEPRVARSGYDHQTLQHQCGTAAHRLWAPWNGGCVNCGIQASPEHGSK